MLQFSVNVSTTGQSYPHSMRRFAACAQNLGLAIIPMEIAEPVAQALGIRTIPLRDDWARRRFAICSRDFDTLSPVGKMLVDFLEDRANSA